MTHRHVGLLKKEQETWMCSLCRSIFVGPSAKRLAQKCEKACLKRSRRGLPPKMGRFHDYP